MRTNSNAPQTPLWQLSKDDFMALQGDLIKKAIADFVKEHGLQKQPTNKNTDEPIDLNEAMALTGLSKQTIYCKISRGEMPVLSRRRPLRFSRKDLLQWINDGRPTNIERQLKSKRNGK